MDFFDEKYYSINKRLLCVLGQWPYQSVLERSLKTLMTLIMMSTIMIPQLIKLPQIWNRVDILSETVSSLMTNSLCIVKLFNCVINTQKMKRILEQTREDWKYERYLPEMNVLRKYGEKARHYTISYFFFIYIVLATWILMPLVPIFMDLIIPLNESRPHDPLYLTDYKIDPDKYFYLIYFIGSVSSIESVLIIVAADTFYMSTAQHACCLFEILRYRLENITLNPDSREDIEYKQVVSCIKEHKRVIQYIQLIESSCEWSLFCVVGFNMVLMSFTGARIVGKSSDNKDVVRFGTFCMAQMIHLYCNTLPGQWILDSSSRIRDSAYGCSWYMMSLKSRKLLLLLIRQSIEPCTITAGKIYVMSMENYSSVLQTSASYFTLLTSLQ